MKNSFYLIFFFIFSVSFSREKGDSSKSKLKAGCTVSLNSNGISSIPAFSLGEPAIMSFISLSKGRFSYDPVLAYGIDTRPWFIDNWLHYLVVDRPVIKVRTGVNFSMYFSDLKLPDETILQGERYWAFELAGIYNITSRSNLTFLYWNDRGQDPGTILGHFISLAGERSEIKVGKSVLLSTNLQIFYIDYDGDNDGLFVSPKISYALCDIPVTLFLQATQPIVTNISPYPGFEWNIGLSFTF